MHVRDLSFGGMELDIDAILEVSLTYIYIYISFKFSFKEMMQKSTYVSYFCTRMELVKLQLAKDVAYHVFCLFVCLFVVILCVY